MFGAVILIISIVIFLLAIKFTWQNLSDLDNSKKIIYIVIGSLINIIISLIIFNLSKGEIDYDIDVLNKMKMVLISVITPINMLITLPFVANTIDKIRYKEIEEEKLKKRIIFYALFIIIFLIFETNYLKDIQLGAMQIFENLNK